MQKLVRLWHPFLFARNLSGLLNAKCGNTGIFRLKRFIETKLKIIEDERKV